MAVGLGGLLAMAGCDSDADPARPRADETSTPPADADTQLVERVQRQVLDAVAVVAGARQGQRDLRRRLRPLEDLHGAHLEALGYEGRAAAGSVAERGADPLDLVRRAETELQRQLTNAAVRASSGALAKLFASMAAAVAQQRAVLR